MSESNIPPESAIVEVSQETTELVKKEMPNANEDVIKETAALFEAIKNRAQAEWQTASELTRETYLNAVRKAQEAIEKNQTQAKEQIDHAGQLVRQEAEKNWRVLDAIKTRAQAQVQSVGDVSRDNYIKAVRQAREAVEENQLIERDRIEQAVQDIIKEAEKNWLVIFSEIESLGVRIAETAKVAWNDLMTSLSKDKDSTGPTPPSAS